MNTPERKNSSGETLEQTVEKSIRQRGLFTYDLVPEESIEVSFSGVIEGVEVVEERIIRARCIDPRIGSLEVLEDSAELDESWSGRIVCLGSYASAIANITFEKAGLLRGVVGLNQGVVVDLAGRHFNHPDSVVEYKMAEYETLFLQEQRIF